MSTFVGAQGELIVDTTNSRVQVHDGSTAGGFSAAKMTDVAFRRALSSAGSGTIAATDKTIAITTLTSSFALYLPPASSFPTGTVLTIVDETGQCSASKPITVNRSGSSDTINGLAALAIVTPYGYMAVQSNGVGKWTVVDKASNNLPLATFVDVSVNANTSISSGAFTRIPLGTVVTDPGSNWDATNYWYTCPRTGLYSITGSLRVGQNGSTTNTPSATYYTGVYTTEADGPWGLWHFTPPANGQATRSTYPYARLSYQTAGDKLRMFTYTDNSGGIIVTSAGLQICLISDAAAT